MIKKCLNLKVVLSAIALSSLATLSVIINPAFAQSSSSGSSSTSTATSAASTGTSIWSLCQSYVGTNPSEKFRLPKELGGQDDRDDNNQAKPQQWDPSGKPGVDPIGSWYPNSPAAKFAFQVDSGVTAGALDKAVSTGVHGHRMSTMESAIGKMVAADNVVKGVQYPNNAAQAAKAQQMAHGTQVGNAMGEAAKGQAAAAIDYTSKYLQNFTAVDGNRWTAIHDKIFVPIALLLLLPGALATQVKAMMSSANPTLGDSNPFEGMLKAMIAVFLIPCSSLILSYGIDFSNSIIYSISSEYTNLFGTSMYSDAMQAQVTAFPTRGPKENQVTNAAQTWQTQAVNDVKSFENSFIANSTTGNNPQPNRTDEGMPSGAMAARFLNFTGNAALTGTWNILCAFQTAYLEYLYLVGPIVAALWVWPVASLRGAFPNWVEGVITISFWSLFWNTTVLLMACFSNMDGTGTIMMTALNFLSTACVKFAFDFAGLVQAAGAEAAKQATSGGGGGGGGQGGKGGKGGKQGKHDAHAAAHKLTNKGQHPTTHPTKPGQHGVPLHAPATHPATVGLGTPKNVGGATGAKFTHTGEGGPLGNVSAPGNVRHGSFMTEHGPMVDPPHAGVGGKTQSAEHTSSFAMGSDKLSLSFDKAGNMTGSTLNDAHGNPVAYMHHDDIAKGNTSVGTADGGKLSLSTVDGKQQFSYTDAQGNVHGLGVDQHGNASMTAGAGADAKEIGSSNVFDRPGVDAIALQGQNGSMYMDKNGERLFVPNEHGGFDSVSLQKGDANGHFELANGQKVDFDHEASGQLATVSLSDSHGKTLDSFAVTDLTSHSGMISHTGADGVMSKTAFSTDGQTATYTHLGDHGQTTQVDTVNANGGNSAFYNADNSYAGKAQWSYDKEGALNTQYFDSHNALQASVEHQTMPGGFIDTVRDANGQVMSQQEERLLANGEKVAEYAKFGANQQPEFLQASQFSVNGDFMKSESQYFANGELTAAASFEPTANGYFKESYTAFDANQQPTGTTHSIVDSSGAVVNGQYAESGISNAVYTGEPPNFNSMIQNAAYTGDSNFNNLASNVSFETSGVGGTTYASGQSDGSGGPSASPGTFERVSAPIEGTPISNFIPPSENGPTIASTPFFASDASGAQLTGGVNYSNFSEPSVSSMSGAAPMSEQPPTIGTFAQLGGVDISSATNVQAGYESASAASSVPTFAQSEYGVRTDSAGNLQYNYPNSVVDGSGTPGVDYIGSNGQSAAGGVFNLSSDAPPTMSGGTVMGDSTYNQTLPIISQGDITNSVDNYGNFQVNNPGVFTTSDGTGAPGTGSSVQYNQELPTFAQNQYGTTVDASGNTQISPLSSNGFDGVPGVPAMSSNGFDGVPGVPAMSSNGFDGASAMPTINSSGFDGTSGLSGAPGVGPIASDASFTPSNFATSGADPQFLPSAAGMSSIGVDGQAGSGMPMMTQAGAVDALTGQNMTGGGGTIFNTADTSGAVNNGLAMGDVNHNYTTENSAAAASSQAAQEMRVAEQRASYEQQVNASATSSSGDSTNNMSWNDVRAVAGDAAGPQIYSHPEQQSIAYDNNVFHGDHVPTYDNTVVQGDHAPVYDNTVYQGDQAPNYTPQIIEGLIGATAAAYQAFPDSPAPREVVTPNMVNYEAPTTITPQVPQAPVQLAAAENVSVQPPNPVHVEQPEVAPQQTAEPKAPQIAEPNKMVSRQPVASTLPPNANNLAAAAQNMTRAESIDGIGNVHNPDAAPTELPPDAGSNSVPFGVTTQGSAYTPTKQLLAEIGPYDEEERKKKEAEQQAQKPSSTLNGVFQRMKKPKPPNMDA